MAPAQKISTLWIVVVINIAFADILSFLYPGVIAQYLEGVAENVVITPTLLVVAAVLLEIGILMIYLSVATSQRISRILNLIAAPITILFVLGGGSFMPHYVFFASVEVLLLAYITYLAWGWRQTAA